MKSVCVFGRNALSSQSLKEQRRITNTQQYRRTTSDGIRRGIPTAISNTHVDSLNHINKKSVKVKKKC